MDEYPPSRTVQQLVRLDPSELTTEEKSRLERARHIPEAVRNVLLERVRQIDKQVLELEAEGDQIKDFLQGFWKAEGTENG